jgi:transglutaminase-like putative cysteine protease
VAVSFDTSGDNPLTPFYPFAVAGAGLLAFVTVDRKPELGLSFDLAKNLAFGSAMLALLEWWYDEHLLILALGHWLIYLELVEMFRVKSVEEDWYLFLLGVVQVLIGGFLGQGDWLGAVIVAWALTALWTLSLFYLRREAARDQKIPDVVVTPNPDRSEPYPGLIDTPFLISATNVALITLFLGGVIFLVMPRWSTPARGQSGGSVTKHMTGFSEEVKLGQIGEILEDDSVVMTVEFYDEANNRIAPEAGTEPLWRGITMQTYKDERWSRQPPSRGEGKHQPTAEGTSFPAKTMRQVIRLEPSDSDALFGLRPILRPLGHELAMNPIDGTIYRFDMRSDVPGVEKSDSRPGTYEYEVLSARDGSLIQRGEYYPSREKIRNKLLKVPEPLIAHLPVLVDRIIAELPPDQQGAEQKARKLEAYLRDSGEFSYSLRMEPKDRTLDPIEDFLVNRKQGHCEYFASSLALMLRSAGVPSRMVNGFKGGDWSDLTQMMTVRGKHAHSWVEALIGEGEHGEPLWITLDPTPGAQRDAAVAKVGGISNRFLPFKDYIRYLWIFYVAGFNSDRQEQLIYRPIRQLLVDAITGFRAMGTALRGLIRWIFHFPEGYSFFSVKGFLVSFFGLLLVAGLLRTIVWAVQRIGHWIRRSESSDADLHSGVATYRRLLALLAQHGLERPPAETPREFARRAGDVLAGRSRDVEAVADVPLAVVDAFYRIRFGHLRPIPEVQRLLETRLDELEASLRPKTV